jgi:hypothetical protein
MNIKFTPSARTQLELVIGTLSNDTGFIIGQEFGKIRLIEELFPINFDESSVDMLYAKMYSKHGDRLMGVFFNNSEPFLNDWFIEDIIIKIKYPQPEFYFYETPGQYVRLPGITI